MPGEPFGYRLDERVDETRFGVRGGEEGLLPVCCYVEWPRAQVVKGAENHREESISAKSCRMVLSASPFLEGPERDVLKWAAACHGHQSTT
ncbi:hypothetical protein EYF80_045485 [Liparis tanakae]|uniref:Uncharacterized protein n=1 Tax=Liparis tanakae TaxID=230148 RepID=A0A4Z2FVI1_9TELE|nr:hypothetical protein EYF80_045485 [Liparis tanakae]